MSLQVVIEMNNHAVSLLEAQQFQEAIPISISALRQVQALTVSTGRELLERQQHHHFPVDLLMRANNLDGFDNGDASEHPFIYEHGIVLPPNIADIPAISSIIIFNVALSYQSSRSSADWRRSQEFLGRGRGLYELLLHEQCHCCNPAFRVATLNNLGVICRSIEGGDHEDEAEGLFSYLQSFALYLLTAGRGHKIQKVNGFWTNVQPDNQAAPAA